MKLTLRTLTALMLCLSTGMAFADKKHDNKKDKECREEGDGIRRKKIEVTNTKDRGHGSLRWAIEKANCLGCPAHIVFDLKKSDCNYNCETETWVIRPQSDLPTITAESLWIDFLSQKGSKPNCNPIEKPNCARLKIEIEGPGIEEVSGAAAANAALVLPTRAFEFAEGAINGRITGANITRIFAGIVTSAPRTTADQGQFGITQAAVKPVVTAFVAHPTAVDARLFNIHAVGLGRVSLFDDASAKSASSAILFGDLGGLATIRARGFTIGKSVGGTNLAGTTQAHPNLQLGLLLDIADSSPAAAAVTADDLVADNLVIAGHAFANAAVYQADRATFNKLALGTGIQRRPLLPFGGINNETVKADAAAAVTLLSLHGLLLLNLRPIFSTAAPAQFTPRGFFQIIRTTAGGNYSGITAGTVLLPGTDKVAAPSLFLDAVHTVNLSDSFLGHTGTNAVTNNTGYTGALVLNQALLRSTIAANLLHGAHFLPVNLDVVSDKAAVLFPTIALADNFVGRTVGGLAAGNGVTGVSVQTQACTFNQDI